MVVSVLIPLCAGGGNPYGDINFLTVCAESRSLTPTPNFPPQPRVYFTITPQALSSVSFVDQLLSSCQLHLHQRHKQYGHEGRKRYWSHRAGFGLSGISTTKNTYLSSRMSSPEGRDKKRPSISIVSPTQYLLYYYFSFHVQSCGAIFSPSFEISTPLFALFSLRTILFQLLQQLTGRFHDIYCTSCLRDV